jgi:protein subunit release factor A
MEALAGLSIAANVMQVIAFSRDTVALCKTLRQTGSIDPALGERTIKVRSLVEDLESKLSQSAVLLAQSQNATVNTKLPDLCKDVVSSAKDLEARLQPLTGQKRRRLGAAKVAFKTMIDKSGIEQLERALHQLEQTLQTQLLAGIWYNTAVVLIKA